MFEYTSAAFNKIKNDIRKLMLIINTSIIVGSIAYLVHSLITGAGNVYANAVLCTVTAAYFVFFVLKTKKLITKKEFSASKRIYKIIKLTVNALVLLLAVYGIIAGVESGASIIKTYLLLALWLVQVILEVLTWAIETIVETMMAAFKYDAFWIAKLLNKNTSRVSKDDPYIRQLEPLVEAARKEKTEKEAAEKQEKMHNFKDKLESFFVNK